MVMAVRLTAIFPILRSNMNMTTGINIMREIEVEVILPHYSLPHDHQHISSPEKMVSNNVLMSLFRPMDHYNDIGHVNTDVTLQLNV